MFSAWDFNSWIFSVGVMLFILSVLTGVGAFVTVLVSRIWGEATENAPTARKSRTQKEPPIRQVA